ncbi:MAG: DEAD/DEAH box helicase, partial [Waterburya sp.]
MMKLRDYQQQLIRDIYSHFRAGKRRCLVFAPTGSGKSLIICKIVADALTKNKRILIVVHRKKLANQLAESIQRFCNTQPSLITQDGKADYSQPVQIAMAQTLSRRKLPEDINILIGDEIHQTGYFNVWKKCLDKYCGSIWALSKAFVVGLTATP